MLLMIDNYDSFTFNLVQYFAELGEDVRVFRNDEITLEGISELKPAQLVLSPGDKVVTSSYENYGTMQELVLKEE